MSQTAEGVMIDHALGYGLAVDWLIGKVLVEDRKV
jgi:hypothetical protein